MRQMIVILMAILAITTVEAAALASAPHWGACHVAPFQLELNTSVTSYVNSNGDTYRLMGGAMSGDLNESIYRVVCTQDGCSDPEKVISLSSDSHDFMAVVNGTEVIISSYRLGYLSFLRCDWDNTTMEAITECTELNQGVWLGNYMSVYEGNLYADVYNNFFVKYSMTSWEKTMVPDLSFNSNNGAYGIHVGDGYAVVALTCEAPVFCSQDVALYTMSGSGTEWTPSGLMEGMNTGNTAGAPFVQKEDNTLLFIQDGTIMECPASCEGVTCEVNQFCSMGVCEDPCAEVECPVGKECVLDGEEPICQDKCLSMECPVLCDLGICHDPCEAYPCEDWESCELNGEDPICIDQGCDPSCEAWEDCFEGQCFDGGCAEECDLRETCFEGSCACGTPLTCEDYPGEYGDFPDGCGDTIPCLPPDPCEDPLAHITVTDGTCTVTDYCTTNPFIDPIDFEGSCTITMDFGEGDIAIFEIQNAKITCSRDLCVAEYGSGVVIDGKITIEGVVTGTVGTTIEWSTDGYLLEVAVPEGRAWWYPENTPEDAIIVGENCDHCTSNCHSWDNYPAEAECPEAVSEAEVSAEETPDGDTDGDVDTEDETEVEIPVDGDTDGDDPDGDDPDGDDPTDGDETPEDGDDERTPIDGDTTPDGDDPIDGNGATGGGGCNATNSNTSIPFFFFSLLLVLRLRKRRVQS